MKGQFIAMQAFVPLVIRNKLYVLLDDMQPTPDDQVKKLIEAEISSMNSNAYNLEYLFEPIHFDKSSLLGCASIAQVHKATLNHHNVNGIPHLKHIFHNYRFKDVVLKIQHDNMEQTMANDLLNFEKLARLLQKTELKFDLLNPIHELKSQISKEFDFVHEAKAMSQSWQSLRHIRGLTVPQVIPELSNKRLLTMQYIDGVPLSKLHLEIQTNKSQLKYIGKRIVRKLSKAYEQMILVDGYFHADVQPGNVLVRNRNIDIGLIDFGQMKSLTESQRIQFNRLVHSMTRKDIDGIKQHMKDLGIKVKLNDPNASDRDESVVYEKLAYTMFDTARVKGVSDNPFSEQSVLRDATVTDLPKDLMLLLRTTQILKGICRATYNDDFSVVNTWKRTAIRQIREFRD